MFMPTHGFAQRPILSPLDESIQCANKFLNTWPASRPVTHKTPSSLPTLPIQGASTFLKPVFHQPPSLSFVPELNSDK
jgi:hypothetical protein